MLVVPIANEPPRPNRIAGISIREMTLNEIPDDAELVFEQHFRPKNNTEFIALHKGHVLYCRYIPIEEFLPEPCYN